MVRRAISNIRNVLVRQQTEILSVAGMLIAISLVTKVFGLLFNSRAAGVLGPQTYSSFLFASSFPELFSQIFLFGSIGASVLPILVQILDKHGQERFLRVFSTLINVSLLVFISLALLLTVFAGDILPWFIEFVIRPATPPTVIEMKNLVEMMKFMMIPQIILGVSVYISTALNLYERFLVPQLAPLFYNIGRLAALYLLFPVLGKSPWVLVWGTIIGAVVHLLIQLPVLRHVGVRYLPVMDIKDQFMKRIGIVAVPRLMSISVEQIGITIDSFIAFGLVGSSLALYNLGVLIVSVPLSIIGTSFATATFPSLAKAFAKQERIIASQLFVRILNQIVFFSVPLAVILLVLRVPIVRLTYGMFGSEIGFSDTYAIAWVVMFFAPGIVLESLRTFLYRTFYAANDTLRPLLLSITVLLLGVGTGLLFTNYLSHFNSFDLTRIDFNLQYFFSRDNGSSAVGGLALSSSVIFTVEALILITWLNRKHFNLHWWDIWVPLAKKALAGALTFAFAYFTFKIWAGLQMTEKTLYLVVLTGITAVTSILVYIGVSGLLRIKEVNVYWQYLAKLPDINVLKLLSKIKKYQVISPSPVNESNQ